MADTQSDVVVEAETIVVGDVVTTPESNASEAMETSLQQEAEDASDAMSLAVATEALVVAETAEINTKTVATIAIDAAKGLDELWQMLQTLQMESGLMDTRLTTLETLVSTSIPQTSHPEPPVESAPETVIVEPTTEQATIVVSSESVEDASPAQKTSRNRRWM